MDSVQETVWHHRKVVVQKFDCRNSQVPIQFARSKGFRATFDRFRGHTLGGVLCVARLTRRPFFCRLNKNTRDG